jgi:hypothetical protein
MVLDLRRGLLGRSLQVRIFGALRRALHELQRLSMILDHRVHVLAVEFLARGRLQLLHGLLVLRIRRRRQRHVLRVRELLQLVEQLRVIVDHLLREFLDLGILRLVDSELSGLDLRQIVLRELGHALRISARAPRTPLTESWRHGPCVPDQCSSTNHPSKEH